LYSKSIIKHAEANKDYLSAAIKRYEHYKMGKVYNEVFHKVIFVSKSALDAYKIMYPRNNCNNLQVIYNPIDVKGIIKLGGIKKDIQKENCFIIINVGNLNPAKRQDRLFEISKRLKVDNIRHKIQIVGEGPLRPLYEKRIRQESLDDTIDLMGFKENPYVYIKNADLFVLSSDYEGLPTVLIETLVLGTPIVATRCTGSVEILKNGELGVLTKKDTESLYLAVKKMIEDNNFLLSFKSKASSNNLVGINAMYEIETLLDTI
jgi:glycosyltransferase involved in cell wall biosynthesis